MNWHQRLLHALLRGRRTAAWLRVVLGVGMMLVMIFHVFGAVEIPLLAEADRSVYDLQLKAGMTGGPGNQDTRIVIANIDEKSLAIIGHWPWRRKVIADLLDTLFDYYHVKTVGFDMAFPEPDQNDGLLLLRSMSEGHLGENAEFKRVRSLLEPQLQYDEMFAKALQNRRIVLGYTFDQKDSALHANTLSGEVGELPADMVGVLPVRRPLGYTANLGLLQSSAKSSGFFDNPTLDEDGVFRRVAPVQEFAGKLYPSLAFALAREALDDALLTLDVRNNDGFYSINSMQLGDYNVPVDTADLTQFGQPSISVMVPFRGPRESFPYLSISDLLARTVAPERLENRIVIVGTTAAGLLDLRTTPMERSYPGVEVHANVIAGILDQRLMRRPSYMIALEAMMVLLSGILVMTVSRRLARTSPLWSAAFNLTLIGVVVAASIVAWHNGVVLSVTNTVVLVIALFMLELLYGFFIEARSKRAITKVFGQYIPPGVANELAANPEQASMEGQSREMTVLFSDVRGFTTLSEKLPPNQLSQLMNTLLTPMTHVIQRHRGTIDKYMGDAIMSFWGAPLLEPQHARLAVLAALDMQRAMHALNVQLNERGWPSVSIGVGLNTGSMVVGNMGSEFRMAYTVLGDSVNLGSRLESLTKTYGVGVIVGENTRVAVDDIAFRELDRVRVKGKDEPVTIHEPIGPMEFVMPEKLKNIAQFEYALQLYRAQQWRDAERVLHELLLSDPDSVLYRLYQERLSYFRDHPPESGWDGVFTFEHK